MKVLLINGSSRKNGNTAIALKVIEDIIKENGITAKIISCGVIIVSILSSIILFNRLRLYDFIIDGMLIYYLFFK